MKRSPADAPEHIFVLMNSLAIVSAGPASAPIDDVRRITNFATGEIGALLAETLIRHGFEVLLFRGRGSTCTDLPQGALLHEFTTNRDLSRALDELSATRGKDVRAVFHAAALSDYLVASVRGPDGTQTLEHKIPSDLPQLHLVLEPAPKLLPRLSAWFPQAWITGWKYELEGTREDAIAAGREHIFRRLTHATIVNGASYGPGFAFLEGENAPVHFEQKREVADFLASRAATFANHHK